MPRDDDVAVGVRGRDQVIGLPRTVCVQAHEVTEAMTDLLDGIVDVLRSRLAALPAERLGEAIEQGIILIGEASVLRNLAEFMHDMTG